VVTAASSAKRVSRKHSSLLTNLGLGFQSENVEEFSISILKVSEDEPSKTTLPFTSS